MAASWIRDPTPVTIKVAERLSDGMIIQNESYIEAHRNKKVESLIIYSNQEYSLSGKLCVKMDGSVYVKNPGDLLDVSYEFIQWELVIPDRPRDEPQPRYILLESQLESLKHHFVHWNLSDPTPTVTCQQLQKYGYNGPQIETSNSCDQKFVWMIPPEESNQFSLQSFGRSYYLAFGSDGKATLCEGGASDQRHNSIFRLESVH